MPSWVPAYSLTPSVIGPSLRTLRTACWPLYARDSRPAARRDRVARRERPLPHDSPLEQRAAHAIAIEGGRRRIQYFGVEDGHIGQHAGGEPAETGLRADDARGSERKRLQRVRQLERFARPQLRATRGRSTTGRGEADEGIRRGHGRIRPRRV